MPPSPPPTTAPCGAANHRHRAVLNAFHGGVPHARVVQACGGITFTQCVEIQACAEMVAFAIEHGGADALGQVLKQIAQCQDEVVAECVALGVALCQTDQCDFRLRATALELQVGMAHGLPPVRLHYGYEI